MNIESIRRCLEASSRPPQQIMAMCLQVLVERPDSQAEHAEALYYYAEALTAVDSARTPECARYAEQAGKLAIAAGAFPIATEAMCLHILLLLRGPVGTGTILDRFDDLKRRLKDEWWPHMVAEQRAEAWQLVTNLGLAIGRKYADT